MNRLFVFILLSLLLVACSGSENGSCTDDGEVCILLRLTEPIHYGEPVFVTITVSSERDIPDLGVSISYDAGVNIDGPENWEEDIRHPMVFNDGASWGVTVNEDQPVVFTRKLFFPDRGGAIWMKAEASTITFRIADVVRIYMTQQGGTVYLAGTPIPITEGPLPTTDPILLETIYAMPSSTPRSTITPRPTIVIEITSTPYPPPSTPPWDNPYP